MATAMPNVARPYESFDYVVSPVSWWRRFLAFIVDMVIVSILCFIIDLIVLTNHVVRTTSPAHSFARTNAGVPPLSPAAEGVLGIVFIVVFLGYFALLTASDSGQTLGKRLVGIQVRDRRTGGRVLLHKAVIRYLVILVAYWLFLVPLILDAFSPLFDAKRLAWHDYAASTVVVDALPDQNRTP